MVQTVTKQTCEVVAAHPGPIILNMFGQKGTTTGQGKGTLPTDGSIQAALVKQQSMLDMPFHGVSVYSDLWGCIKLVTSPTTLATVDMVDDLSLCGRVAVGRFEDTAQRRHHIG
jgi:hypothetical protein